MSVFCFSSLKGGVGKTSLTINIGHAFAIRGCSVLIIDLDPSAHATRFFRKRKASECFPSHPPLARAFLRKDGEGEFDGSSEDDVEQFFVRVRPDLEILPGGNELRHFVPGYGARHFAAKFKPLLEELKLHFDHILIDTPPELNVLTRNSLAQADLVVVPVDASEMSIDSAEDLLDGAGSLTRARWVIARTMVTSVAYRSHSLSNQRLTERLSFLPSGKGSSFALATEEGIRSLPFPRTEGVNEPRKDLYLLETMVFRTEVQNQLSFLGKTSFDTRKTHLLAEQYKAVARELETIVAALEEERTVGLEDSEKEIKTMAGTLLASAQLGMGSTL